MATTERPRFLFEPGRVRVGTRGVGGIKQGGGAGRGGGGARGGGQGKGRGQAAALAAAFGAVSAARGQVVASPVDVAALTLISTTTLTVDGTFDVSGITGIYNDLVLVAILRSTTVAVADTPGMRFNNDSAANYDFQHNYSQLGNVNATASGGTATVYMPVGWVAPAASATAGRFGHFVIEIPGYTSTTWHKQMLSIGGGQGVAGNYTAMQVAGQWRSTAAITRIQISGNAAFSQNLLTGSQLRIYGRL